MSPLPPPFAPDTGNLDPGSEGITINAGTSDTPPEDRKVRWVRESDGAVVAYILGANLSNSDDTYYVVGTDANGPAGSALIRTQAHAPGSGSASGSYADIQARAVPTLGAVTPYSEVRAWAHRDNSGGALKTIIDSDGLSDYYMQPGGKAGGGWNTAGLVWATAAFAGWPTGRIRRTGADVVHFQGMFNMPADALPNGNKQEAFDITGFTPTSGPRIINGIASNGAACRFETSSSSPHLKWTGGGAAGSWFWLSGGWYTSQ